ncbi:hypothetical protein [Azohydromonas lata]|uniref:hypothetical protein n=1 Tax=Azohydromonas lata TaxID=45677 RepID=UPI000830E745|nr:hypothetical protein [Azohydromonas lata]
MGSKEHGDDQGRGLTLDLFGDLEPAPPAPSGAARGGRGKARSRRGANEARREPAQAGTRVPWPADGPGHGGAPQAGADGPARSAAAALGHEVEQALAALPASELQGVVGQVATAIVRSGEFQVALRAQLYTLVAPAISEALRGALAVQEVRQSLRDAFGDGEAGAQALQRAQAAARARDACTVPYAGGLAGAYAAAPRVAQVVQPLAGPTAGSNGDAPLPLGEAVLLAGYEPPLARQYKAALAEAGYESVIVEVGPNDAALPPEAFTCAIACLPDDAAEHVQSLLSRHPLRQVLHVSATPRRLVEAVELVMPPPPQAAG